MSQLPSKLDLKQLAKFNQPHSVSIYAPYMQWSGSTNPNKIMLKNLMRQAKADLLSGGLKPAEADKTIKPIQALLESQEFLPYRHEGLAIFAHSKMFKYFHVPSSGVPRIITVQKGFCLDPLNQLAGQNQSYIVLTLGHSNVRLYMADRYEVRPINLKGFPKDMLKTLHIDELPRVIETHPVGPPERGRASQSFHGQYNVSQTDKTMLLQFFRQINKHLGKFLQGKQLPVVLAGVNYLLPIYRMVNTYPHLAPAGITGSNGSITQNTMRKQGWSIITRLKSTAKPKQYRANYHVRKALK